MARKFKNQVNLPTMEDSLVVTHNKSGKVVSINQVVRDGISPKGRRILNKSLRDRKNPKTWNSEYREHIIYQLVYKLVSPFKPRRSEVAADLGLSLQTLNDLIATEEYQQVKRQLRAELRKKWATDIDAVVIKKALLGSKYHAELYYKLEGELIDKHEVTKKEDIPSDPQQRRELVKKYLHELGMDVGLMNQKGPIRVE